MNEPYKSADRISSKKVIRLQIALRFFLCENIFRDISLTQVLTKPAVSNECSVMFLQVFLNLIYDVSLLWMGQLNKILKFRTPG